MSEGTWTDETVRLADLVAGDPPFIRDKTFLRCHLVGPMMFLLMLPEKPVGFSRNIMNTSQFWPIERGRRYEGAVGIERCTFTECTFKNVGFAADLETIRGFFG